MVLILALFFIKTNAIFFSLEVNLMNAKLDKSWFFVCLFCGKIFDGLPFHLLLVFLYSAISKDVPYFIGVNKE